MLSFNPYLHFAGNSEVAMNFYKSVLGGEFTIFQRYRDIPGGEKIKPEEQNKLIHVSLTFGNGHTIMATDSLQSMNHSLTNGNNFHIVVSTDSEQEADRIFNGLSEQGKIEMPLNKTFWDAYFGMCQDKFGIQWMVNFNYPARN